MFHFCGTVIFITEYSNEKKKLKIFPESYEFNFTYWRRLQKKGKVFFVRRRANILHATGMLWMYNFFIETSEKSGDCGKNRGENGPLRKVVWELCPKGIPITFGPFEWRTRKEKEIYKIFHFFTS